MDVPLKRIVAPTLLALTVATPARAIDPASVYSTFGSLTLMAASPYLLYHMFLRGKHSVSHVRRDRDVAHIRLRSEASGQEGELTIATAVLERTKLREGSIVEVRDVPTGVTFEHDGQVIAYAPDASNHSLAHSRRVSPRP